MSDPKRTINGMNTELLERQIAAHEEEHDAAIADHIDGDA